MIFQNRSWGRVKKNSGRVKKTRSGNISFGPGRARFYLKTGRAVKFGPGPKKRVPSNSGRVLYIPVINLKQHKRRGINFGEMTPYGRLVRS